MTQTEEYRKNILESGKGGQMDLGSRIKYARKRAGVTQDRLFEKTGIGISSLSDFENDKREPSLSQLQSIAEALNRSVGFFLSDEPLKAEIVLWRQKPAEETAAEIETRFLRLCEQYHNLEVWLGAHLGAALPYLEKDPDRFTYRDASALALKVRRHLGLGDYPAQSLLTALEETSGVKVFHLSFEPAGTAACTRSDDCGPSILLNASNVPWRRNFDLAHELFHILTWPTFRTGNDKQEECAGDREEKFATAFAARLLMPDEPIRAEIEESRERGKMNFGGLYDIARKFDVSVEAIIWRMVFLDYIRKEEAPEIIDRYREQSWQYEIDRGRDEPPVRPIRFVVLAHRALRSGEMSLGRFAEYMGLSRAEAKRIMARSPEGDDEVQLAAS